MVKDPPRGLQSPNDPLIGKRVKCIESDTPTAGMQGVVIDSCIWQTRGKYEGKKMWQIHFPEWKVDSCPYFSREEFEVLEEGKE